MKMKVEQQTSDGANALSIYVKTEDGKESEAGINVFSDGTIAMFRTKGNAHIHHDNRKVKGRALTPISMLDELVRFAESELSQYCLVDDEETKRLIRSLSMKVDALALKFSKQAESLHIDAVKYKNKVESQ